MFFTGLRGVECNQEKNGQSTTDATSSESYQQGEHVACVWCDDDSTNLRWYLGVVEGVTGDSVIVSLLKRLPEEADVHS